MKLPVFRVPARRSLFFLRRMSRRGMTLLELLLVMMIIMILATLITEAYRNFARNVDVTNSTDMVTARLNLGRQLAMSKNQYVQVRFFENTDATDDRNGHYTGIAIFRADSPIYTNNYTTVSTNKRFVQEGRVELLPITCAILNDTNYSPLFTLITNVGSYPRRGSNYLLSDSKNYNWVAFYFRPDGSLDVPYTNNAPANNSFAICQIILYKARNNTIPPNYAAIVMDPINGRFQTVRP